MTRLAVSVLVTVQNDPRRILLVRRSPKLKFLGGYLAFPGGVLDEEDQAIPVSGLPADGQAPGAFIVAAARELFEETGLWKPRGLPIVSERLRHYRHDVLGEELTFSDILSRETQTVHAADFEPICRITTPPYSARQR